MPREPSSTQRPRRRSPQPRSPCTQASRAVNLQTPPPLGTSGTSRASQRPLSISTDVGAQGHLSKWLRGVSPTGRSYEDPSQPRTQPPWETDGGCLSVSGLGDSRGGDAYWRLSSPALGEECGGYIEGYKLIAPRADGPNRPSDLPGEGGNHGLRSNSQESGTVRQESDTANPAESIRTFLVRRGANQDTLTHFRSNLDALSDHMQVDPSERSRLRPIAWVVVDDLMED